MRLSGLILSAILLMGCLSAKAHPVSRDTLSAHLTFPRNVSSLQMDCGRNSWEMDRFISDINCINAGSASSIQSVTIRSWASVEGGWHQNEMLSQRRAEEIRDILLKMTALKPSQITITPMGENWQGLRDIISGCDAPWKDMALALIDGSGVIERSDSSSSAGCKNLLKVLHDGEAWAWMQDEAFPRLRCAQAAAVIETMPSDGSSCDTIVITVEHTIVHVDSAVGCPSDCSGKQTGIRTFRNDSLLRTPVMAIRSNLLLPLMNISIEIPLSNRFSIGADWYSPWVMRSWINTVLPSQKYCVQALAGSIQARWWPGHIHRRDAERRYRLLGHSVALAAVGGYYDLENDGSGQQGEFCGLGVDWMFAMPLGKGGVHMEFSIGVAALWNTYRDYRVFSEGGYLTADGSRHSRIVPIPFRTGVSLCIPIMARKEAGR